MKIGSVAVAASIAGIIAILIVVFLFPPLSSTPAKSAETQRLVLVPLLKQKAPQIAAEIVRAADDGIVNLRLNDTDTLRTIAYTTSKGDIILPIDGLEDSRIEYWIWEPVARPLTNPYAVEGSGYRIEDSDAMNFTKTFLENIGYKLNGTERFFVEGIADYPDAITTITVFQTVSGCDGTIELYSVKGDNCVIANNPTSFHFKNDGAWIELKNWYEDVHLKEIKVTEEQAKLAAKNFIEDERKQNPEKFEGFGNLTFNDVWQPTRKETYKDNLVYAVTVSYLTDKSPEEYHCAPATNFDVFVSVEDGKALGWKQSACA